MKETAVQFGQSLDTDDYQLTQTLLAQDCVYEIGEEVIHGAKNIVASYEENMLAGRKKMDKLEWGESSIEEIKNNEFIVHFTDYLYHKNKKYVHKCRQKLFTNSEGKIHRIEHIADKKEQTALNAWYQSVGIPTSSL